VDRSIPGTAYTDQNGVYDRDESCFDGTGNPAEAPKPAGAGDLPGAGACGGILSAETRANIALSDPDLKYPQQLRLSFGVDQELPFANLVATLEGQYSSTINGISARNLNIASPESGLQESAYGRPLYGSNIGGGFGTPNRVDDQFGSVILLENANEGYEYFLTAELAREARTGLNWSVAYNFNRARSIFNGSFDVASSLWQQNFAVDPNDPELGTAEYEGRHRVLITGNYRFSWGEDLLSLSGDRLSTTVGAFFETRSGGPVTWIHGFSDANGDGFPFNDLPYVPEDRRDIVLTTQNWDLMDSFISSEPALDEARGGFVDRYSGTAPWRTILDLKVTQRIETFEGQKLELIANLENVLNALNDEWGRIQFTSFNNLFAWTVDGYVRQEDVGSRMGGRVITEDDLGKPIVSFDEQIVRDKLADQRFSNASTASRWQLQLGFRYTF
jgi:hypothetical protein